MTGSNIKFLQQKYDCLTLTDLFSSQSEISKSIVKQVKNEDVWKVDLLEELINIREGHLDVNLLEKEITELIYYVGQI